MAGNVTLVGRHLKIAEQLLHDTSEALMQFNLPYWLEGGTLLGIVRENRLLPWDNDVDLSIRSENSKTLLQVLNKLKAAGYRVRIRRFDHDHGCFKVGDIRLIKVRKKYLFGLGKSKVCLDIFVKYTQGDNACWMVSDIPKAVPKKYYQDLIETGFNGFNYSIPKLFDEYLSYRYGDWREPVKQWNTFEDDKALITDD